MEIRKLTKIALGTSLIAVGAFIKIPSPITGFFTLQLPLLILISVVLGSRISSKSALLYMFGGLIGIPWFASGGGLIYLVKPSFGFIISFVVAAYIAGKSYKHDKRSMVVLYSVLATLLVWIYGMFHYVTISKIYTGLDISYIFMLGVLVSPDFYIDIILTIVFSSIGIKIKRLI